MDLKSAFDKHEDEFLRFEKILNPRHGRPDLCAFLILSDFVPNSERNMVAGAVHDEIFLGVDPDAVSKVITDEQVLDLVRCGVRYDPDTDSLCMFV